ncbi:MAG: hypothetical protein IKF52_04035 [Clostridia bacterium]|nr:hypothetical protein [Clostridia bacterium]
MRIFLRFIHISFISLLLFILALSISIIEMTTNEKNLKKQIDKAGVYERINDELKLELKKQLRDEFNQYPEIGVDLDELVDETVKSDILKGEAEEVLDQVFNNSSTVTIDTNLLLSEYRYNLDTYLMLKNIELPSEIDRKIDELIKERSEDEIDISKYTKEVKPIFNDYKNLAKGAIVVLAVLIIGLEIVAILLSTEKLKIIYIPLFITGAFLLLFRFGVNGLFKSIKITERKEMAESIIVALKNTLVSNIDKYAIIFIVIGLIFVGTKIWLDKKESRY